VAAVDQERPGQRNEHAEEKEWQGQHEAQPGGGHCDEGPLGRRPEGAGQP
jgi:hypothetical protein